MKRLPLKVLLLLVYVLCMGSECDPSFHSLNNEGVWRVKNSTGRTLWIKPVNSVYGSTELAAGGEIDIVISEFPIQDMPAFGSLLSRWGDFTAENIRFTVLSDDGSPLAEWSYAELEGAGRHFFDERSWTRSVSDGRRVDELTVTWTFEITTADIAKSEKQNLP